MEGPDNSHRMHAVSEGERELRASQPVSKTERENETTGRTPIL